MTRAQRWGGYESLRGAELLFTGWLGLLMGSFSAGSVQAAR